MTSLVRRGGYISRIEIENFKSYAGEHVLGPFREFTTIIGPNGSGKSNLMDAISFVMGLRAGSLRGNSLRDLIYSGDRSHKAPRNARVKLVFLHGFEGEQQEEIHFQRSILSNQSEYRINGRVVTYDEYIDHWKVLGVHLRARNFLIFQGDVESISVKNPVELTSLLEEVSGSSEFVQEYTNAKTELEKLSEEVSRLATRKRGISTEKTEYQKQRTEMKKYEDLKHRLESLKVEKALFELYQIEKSCRNLDRKHREKVEAVADAASTLSAIENQLEKYEREQALLQQELHEADEKLKVATNKLAQERPSHMQIEKELKNRESRIENLRNELNRKRNDQQNILESIQRLEEQLEEVQSAFDVFERQPGVSQSQEIDLVVGSQLPEYNKLKETAGQITLSLSQQLEQVKRQKQINEDNLRVVQDELEQLIEQRKIVQDKSDADRSRCDKLSTALLNKQRELEGLQLELRDTEVRVDSSREKRRRIDEEVLEISQEIQMAQSVEAESEQDLRLRDAVEAMKRIHQRRVRGRLYDLCEIDAGFEIAATAVLGRFMDAIVVETESVAKECMKYLRENRIGTALFLPLDTIRVEPLKEYLRRSVQNGRLLVDIVHCDESIDKAVKFACGNAVVFETLSDAMDYCYDNSKEKIKGVTRDGTIIYKSGVMSGGQSGLERRAKKWSSKDTSDLRSAHRSKVDEVALLRQQCRDDEHKISQLRSQIQVLESQIKSVTLDVSTTSNRFQQHDLDLERFYEQIQLKRERCDELRLLISEKKSETERLEIDIMSRTDEIFRDFSRRVGVRDIREYEKRYVEQAMSRLQQRKLYEDQISKLRSSIEYEESRKLDRDISDLDRRMHEDERRVAELQKAKTKVERVIEKLKEELSSVKRDKDDVKKRVEMKVVQVRELKEQRRSKQDLLRSLENKRVDLENSLNTSRASRHRTYLSLSTDVSIPAADASTVAASAARRLRQVPHAGSRSTTSRRSGRRNRGMAVDDVEDVDEESAVAPRGRRSSSRSSGPERDSEEEEEEILFSEAIYPDEDEDETNGSNDPNSSPSSLGRRRRDAVEEIYIDFSHLDSKLRETSSVASLDKVRSELEEKIRDIETAMDLLAPNRFAEEHLRSIRDKLRDLDEEESTIRASYDDATRRFDQVKADRLNAFMSAFEPISQNLTRIYAQLTRSSVNPRGGSAHLILDDMQEPYLYGVRYNTMPPNKRFREMDQLSGGEKTVAALALVFALHSFRPSPFFVMDEIDAALDEVNVARVANFIMQRSRGSIEGPSSLPRDDGDFESMSAISQSSARSYEFPPCQFIIISLKDSFYGKADALVGVYRDPTTDSSKTATFDLQPFPIESRG